MQKVSIVHTRLYGCWPQSPTPEGPIDESHNAPRLEEYDNDYVEDEDYDQYGEDENLLPHSNAAGEEDENLFPQRHAAGEEDENLLPHRHAPARSAINITIATNVRPCFANDTHVATEERLLPPRPVAARSAINKTTTPTIDGPPCFAHDDLVGKDVLLFAIFRNESVVARGTVISTNPNTMVGGQPLGNEYCEVVVNVVIKRDAILPRSYGSMETMASALKMAIAWPYNKIKEYRKKELQKAPRPPKGTAGEMAPRVPRRTVAEMDAEFDELAAALSKDPRDQLTSVIGSAGHKSVA